MQNKIINGARAKIYLQRPGDAAPKLIGFFNSVSCQVAYDVQPAFTLGRYSAADVNYTAMELVAVRASGYRVYGNDPNDIAPTVNDLLAQTEGMTLLIYDRQSPGKKPIMNVTGLLCTGYDTGVSARGQSEVSFNFVGRTVEQEGQGDNKLSEEDAKKAPNESASELDDGP